MLTKMFINLSYEHFESLFFKTSFINDCSSYAIFAFHVTDGFPIILASRGERLQELVLFCFRTLTSLLNLKRSYCISVPRRKTIRQRDRRWKKAIEKMASIECHQSS